MTSKARQKIGCYLRQFPALERSGEAAEVVTEAVMTACAFEAAEANFAEQLCWPSEDAVAQNAATAQTDHAFILLYVVQLRAKRQATSGR